MSRRPASIVDGHSSYVVDALLAVKLRRGRTLVTVLDYYNDRVCYAVQLFGEPT